jgi:hypothetical protein
VGVVQRLIIVKSSLAALVLLLTGCSADGGREVDRLPSPTTGGASPTAGTSPDQPTTALEPGLADPAPVGVLVGARLGDVRRALAGQDVRVRVRKRASCRPGVVLAQRPTPGTQVDRGATLHLVVARAPVAATCAFPDAARAVRRLEAWARGDEAAPELAPAVRLLVANRPVRTLIAAQTTDPDEWTIDVAYAERTEVGVLDLLSSGPMADRDVPPFFCPVKDVALPRDLVRRLPSSWSLVTRRPRACLEETAVQVWTDAVGRITDVNVLLGSP